MKAINLFEVGEEVYVKAVVTGMTIDQGEIKYHLKNDVTGRNYDHLFRGDQLYPEDGIIDAKTMVNEQNKLVENLEKRQKDIDPIHTGRKRDDH